MAKPVILRFLGDGHSLEKTFDKLEGKSGGFGGKLAKLGKFAAVGFAAVATAAIATGAVLLHEGDKLNESQDLLKNALKNTGQGVGGLSSKLTPLMKQMEGWGYSNDQVNDGLASLVRAGDKLTTATKDEALAANVAKGRHIDLAAAEQLLVKVRTGHVALLGRYGIQTKDATGKTISITAAVGKLSKMYGGAASTAAESLAGKSATLHAWLKNTEEHLGQKLIPVFLKWAEFLTAKVVPAIGSLVRFISEKWPEVEAAVLPVIDKIHGYIEGFVSTVEHLWSQFGGRILSFAKKAWNGIKTEISGVIQVIEGVFRLFADLLTGKWKKLGDDLLKIVKGLGTLLLGSFKVAWAAITTVVSLAWDGLKNIARGAIPHIVSYVKGIPGRVLGLAKDFASAGVNLGGKIMGGIVDGISGAAHGVANIAKTIYNAFAGFVNRNLIDKLKSVSVGAFGVHVHPFSAIPDIPLLARGGVFDSPTLAVIGEASSPRNREIATPEKLLREVVRDESGGGKLSRTRQLVIENMTVTALNPREAARQMGEDLAWAAKTSGY